MNKNCVCVLLQHATCKNKNSPLHLSPSEGPSSASSPQTPPCGGAGHHHDSQVFAPGLRVQGPLERMLCPFCPCNRSSSCRSGRTACECSRASGHGRWGRSRCASCHPGNTATVLSSGESHLSSECSGDEKSTVIIINKRPLKVLWRILKLMSNNLRHWQDAVKHGRFGDGCNLRYVKTLSYPS